MGGGVVGVALDIHRQMQYEKRLEERREVARKERGMEDRIKARIDADRVAELRTIISLADRVAELEKTVAQLRAEKSSSAD